MYSWYKEPWAWFVLAPILLVILACAITISIAFHYADDRVTDNYYREGRMINQRFEQDQRTLKLGLSAELRFEFDTGEVMLSLASETGEGALKRLDVLPEKLLLLLNHPTSAALDQQIILSQIFPGRYRGDLDQRLHHRWYIYLIPTLDAKKHIEAQWRLTGELDFAKTTLVKLIASTPHLSAHKPTVLNGPAKAPAVFPATVP